MVAAVVSFVLGVSAPPSTDGMPGAALIEKILSWLTSGALYGSLASLLIGAMIWGFSQHNGYSPGASKGRMLAIAGVIGALLAGLAPAIVNGLFTVASNTK